MNTTKFKTLLLDMDGVLVNFLIHWLSYLDLYYGIQLKVEDVTDWGLHKVPAVIAIQRKNRWSDAELKAKIYGPFDMPGFWRSAPLMAGARDFIQDLKARQSCNPDFEFYICSSPSGPVCAKEKVEYIQEVFGKDVPYILTKHKHLIKGSMLVDDHPENCYKWLKDFPEGLVVNPATPYGLNELCKLPKDSAAVFNNRISLTEDLMHGKGFGSVLKIIDEKLGLQVPPPLTDVGTLL